MYGHFFLSSGTLDGWISGFARVLNIYDMGVLLSINRFNKKEVGRNDLVSHLWSLSYTGRLTLHLLSFFFIIFSYFLLTVLKRKLLEIS